ncbi:MAG: 50S ribosomal protein L4 [Candidatus Sungbacteria bacterium]|uniref:Large ribosomal subunit protein uL4 n=1 Tax=Candidatus Sungiibacteriota bacterium TaxID=2750080 RepID=A0A933DRP0_9BACT|nr:50S ribosomal protein L4 [Candidatus Sungbacteria bacterium]
MRVKVYNTAGTESGEMELPKVFALPWNADLVHQVVTSQMANRRQPLAHTKGRGEVSGGGRKPWRQKGTGRARHGSIRSPLWKGGGVTHGPTKFKNFRKKINKKMAARALATTLSAKVRDNELLVLEGFAVGPKTKAAAGVFQKLSAISAYRDLVAKPKRALVLLPDSAPGVRRALRNLPGVAVEDAHNITALDVINRKYVVIPKSAIDILARRLEP